MIYIFFALLFWIFYLLTSKGSLFSRDEKRRRKLQLVEYAGAAAIFAIMLESVLSGRAESIWYPLLVMAVVAVLYTRRIFRYLTRKEE
ncbi:MAG: hypothetical protein LAT84_03475 [Balneolia bacterium]|nr:hypothetical protein [Balneolia bacterium]